MHDEDDLLPISALQHLLFCERQTALIHLEREWQDNRFTAEGQVLHRKADAAKSETRDGIRITRGLPVHSFSLGLSGVCDVVLFQPPAGKPSRRSLPTLIRQQLEQCRLSADGSIPDGSPFLGWLITPVEYKRGKPKSNDCDRVQLCAQAICLEEMLSVEIPQGDLFYGKRQRRTEVAFDRSLRETTQQAARQLHTLIESRQTPSAVREPKCDSCSLLSICLPSAGPDRPVGDYLQRMLTE